MKTIKEYIEFWIENGYERLWQEDTKFEYDWTTDCVTLPKDEYRYDYIIPYITRIDFIEAIARWLELELQDTFDLEAIENNICTTQAIAIRDNKLEEFITNLLWQD